MYDFNVGFTIGFGFSPDSKLGWLLGRTDG